MQSPPAWRRLPVGAEIAPDGGVHFRVWAPKRRRVDVVLEGPARAPARAHPLEPEEDGYFSALVPEASAGTRYRFRLDGQANLHPDPVSRFQPGGVHGPSEVVDPAAFRWRDAGWRGRGLAGSVIYELHLGTFTREGTWRAAIEPLERLAALGITTLEVMPVGDFPGRFNWGYDGVALFAPARIYGTPDDMRAFVDRAHALGLAVILDVVYNHLGPDGNYLREFSDTYFSAKHASEWGDTPNYDGEGADGVREYICANAGYWIDEFHLDGLRLDATQAFFDDSPVERHILTGIGEAVRAAARGRETLVVNENEPQRALLVRPASRGGNGLDAIWNDDFHHSALVALTGADDAYYTDYRGSAQELLSAVKWGFLYQGQWYRWQAARRGSPALDVPLARFVNFLQNHDQVANSGAGERIHCLTSPGRLRAMTALLLLAPSTPMLFMGQEFQASAPFLFFADHDPELAALVARGRAENLAQFLTLGLPEMKRRLATPHDPTTFERCKLDWREWEEHGECVALHRDLLRLRRDEPVFRRQTRQGMDGAILSSECLVVRFFADDGDDRLLVVNVGRTLHLDPAPEPLLAPPQDQVWRILWSSEDPRYGGLGTPQLDAAESDRAVPGRPQTPRPHENWRIPAESAVVLAPAPRAPRDA